MKKGFMSFVEKADFDVLCLQETRAALADAGLSLPGTYVVWNEALKKGYSGAAIYSKIKPLSEALGIGISEHDQEGRVCTAEFKDFYLVNVYTPNSQRELTRLRYRTQEWNKAFLSYLKKLEKKKPVVFCGDLNVAHKEIDLANPKTNRKNAGFTDEERQGFDAFIQNGFIDTFREFEKGGGHYTWWSYMSNARARNIGWRIDYFLVSEILKNKIKNASILSDVQGSDHCPVTLELI